MAKRARGSTSRPGQRAPLARGAVAGRPATRPTEKPAAAVVGAPRPATLTEDEEARAAELEARIVAAERAAEETASRSRRRETRPTDDDARVRASSIATRASEEYAYVSRDVRRIALIGGSIVTFLVGLWVVTAVTGAGPF